MHVYILYSAGLDRYYIGETDHLKHRLLEHNSGAVPATADGVPWTLAGALPCMSRKEAILLAMAIRSSGVTGVKSKDTLQ